MTTMLYLSDAEIADLCTPLTQPAAQVRYLRTLGLTVAVKPIGRAVVIRCHAEAVLSSGAALGTARTSAQLTTLFALANLWMVRKRAEVLDGLNRPLKAKAA